MQKSLLIPAILLTAFSFGLSTSAFTKQNSIKSEWATEKAMWDKVKNEK